MEQGICLCGIVASSHADGVRPSQSLARELMLVGVHQPQPLDERRRGVRRKRPDLLLELERTLEHPGRHPVRVELRQAELRQEHGEQDEVAAVLHDLEPSPAPSLTAAAGPWRGSAVNTRGMTISALSRGSASASTNACSSSRSDLSKSSYRALAEPPQHIRAFGTRRQLLEQRLEDRTRLARASPLA